MSALLRAYDEQLRTDAEVADAERVSRIGPVLAATHERRRRGFVTHAPLPPHTEVVALVSEVLRHYSSLDDIDEVEWKTRSHDATSPVPALLAHGFMAGEVETVMAGRIADIVAADPGLPRGFSLHRAVSEADLAAAQALAGRVFGDDAQRITRRTADLVAQWRRAPEATQMWFVRNPSGEVVCSGRVDFVDGTDFATLWGGACDDAHRGLGLYRAITAERARQAAERGKRWLQVDCTAMSRPILERSGLQAITTTTPFVRHGRAGLTRRG